VTQDELKQARETRHQMHGDMKEKMEQRFKEADANSDGQLSLDEVQSKMPRLAERFSTLDVDKNGQLSKEESVTARHITAKVRNRRPDRRIPRLNGKRRDLTIPPLSFARLRLLRLMGAHRRVAAAAGVRIGADVHRRGEVVRLCRRTRLFGLWRVESARQRTGSAGVRLRLRLRFTDRCGRRRFRRCGRSVFHRVE
jgi:hypothetical protein